MDKDIDLNIVEHSGSEVKNNSNDYESKLDYSRTGSKPNSLSNTNSVVYNEYSFAP